jgi:hypothetical protein
VTATLRPRPLGATPPHLLLAAGGRRLDSLAARYGSDSPQVAAALARWARIIDDARPPRDDLGDLVDVVTAASGGAR